jgi:hypothetical protein
MVVTYLPCKVINLVHNPWSDHSTKPPIVIKKGGVENFESCRNAFQAKKSQTTIASHYMTTLVSF